MNPPKCKTCGIAEWRHVCGGADSDRVIKEARAEAGVTGRSSKAERPSLAGKVVGSNPTALAASGKSKRGVEPTPIAPKPEIATGTKFDRTAYQREYMRRYRARNRKAKP